MKNGKRLSRLIVLVVAIALLPTGALAAQVEEKPTAFDMAADLVIARPLGVVLFGLGSVTYVATLPFSLLGGNAGEAGKVLVVKPARETFVRCLGCTRLGRKEKIQD